MVRTESPHILSITYFEVCKLLETASVFSDQDRSGFPEIAAMFNSDTFYLRRGLLFVVCLSVCLSVGWWSYRMPAA